MLTLFALAFQIGAATTEPAKAAMRCATAAVVAPGKPDVQLRVTSHFMYFAMQAAKAEPGGKPFLARLQELAGSVSKTGIMPAAVAQSEIARCDSAFPLARASTTPKLPADSFDRDVMCMGVLSLLQGAAEEMKDEGPNAGARARITAVLEPLTARITDDVLAKHGIASEAAFVERMGDQLKASLNLGHPASVAGACGVTGI